PGPLQRPPRERRPPLPHPAGAGLRERRVRFAAGLLLLALVAGAVAQTPSPPPPPEPGYLYRAVLVQAAPGKLSELIDLYKSSRAGPGEGLRESPFWMRHSQGDRWDLLLLYPMESYTAYYAPDRVAAREKAA